jgi:hypothetical protein
MRCGWGGDGGIRTWEAIVKLTETQEATEKEVK